MSTTDTNAEAVAPLVIKVSDVLALLDAGKSRKEIAEHYGRTQAEMQVQIWNHPKLKNKKAKKQYEGIILEDDTEEEQAPAQATPVAETSEETVQAGAPDTTADPVKEEEEEAPATEEAPEETAEAVASPAQEW